ncbi:MAG: fibronectin type III domain-containing protein [Bacteroidetes bacterium]|nr:fibronectin type III domain-containing protein [Bacteroidota bacterium]
MKLKMGFLGLSIAEVIDRSTLIVTKMTGNPNFPTPDPTLADVTTAADALLAAYNNSRDGGKTLTATMRLRLKELMELNRKLAAYVQAESSGGEEIILSSGFDVVRRGDPTQVAQVHNLRLQHGIPVGSIRAIWDRVVGAGAYVVELSDTDANGPFSFHLCTLKTRLDFTGLVPGKLYWIRIYAVGRHSTGLPSDISVHTASI